MYDGPTTSSYSPAQGIAWDPANKPTGIMSGGYIVGTWFDASVKAGGDKTITWYHVTDYPGPGLRRHRQHRPLGGRDRGRADPHRRHGSQHDHC